MNGFIIAYSQARKALDPMLDSEALQRCIAAVEQCSSHVPDARSIVKRPRALSQMPAYWQWLNRITPTTWILYALAVNQVPRLTLLSR